MVAPSSPNSSLIHLFAEQVVFIIEMFVRMGAMKPAVYFRDAWFQFDFMNALEAILVIVLNIISAIYARYILGDILSYEYKIWPGIIRIFSSKVLISS